MREDKKEAPEVIFTVKGFPEDSEKRKKAIETMKRNRDLLIQQLRKESDEKKKSR